MVRNIGKYFEDKVTEALKGLQETSPCMYHRFPDSHSARNPLPSQPGDHMLLYRNNAVLIEDKASEVHETFSQGLSALLKKKQAAQHLKWMRAGHETVLLFYSVISGEVEIYSGRYVIPLRMAGKQINFSEALAVCPLGHLQTTLQRLFML